MKFRLTDGRDEPKRAAEMVRVVVDTHIFISALLGLGKARRLVSEQLENPSVVLSKPMLAELGNVLLRDKFTQVRSSEADRFLSIMVRSSMIVAVRSEFKTVTDDPDDDAVVNTAYRGEADYIVTGDKHLLVLKEFKGIKIVKVNQLLGILGGD